MPLSPSSILKDSSAPQAVTQKSWICNTQGGHDYGKYLK